MNTIEYTELDRKYVAMKKKQPKSKLRSLVLALGFATGLTGCATAPLTQEQTESRSYADFNAFGDGKQTIVSGYSGIATKDYHRLEYLAKVISNHPKIFKRGEQYLFRGMYSAATSPHNTVDLVYRAADADHDRVATSKEVLQLQDDLFMQIGREKQ